MYFCFIDEAGDSQPVKNKTDNIQPLLVVTALFIDGTNLKSLTNDFINLKFKYFPGQFKNIKHDLDALTHEIKGDELRKTIRKNPFSSTGSKTAPVLRFIDDILNLLQKYDIKFVSRVWVKQFGLPLTDKSVYTLTTQNICIRFQEYLDQKNDQGMVIADYRDTGRNKYVAHSIFTQKHRKLKGDAYPSILEIPTFGISDNHACLQITDILSTTLLFPIAAQTYCKSYIDNVFIHENYELLKKRYKKRLDNLQFSFANDKGILHPGISVKDGMGQNKNIQMLS